MSPVSHDSETPAVNQQVITACAFIHHVFNGQEKVLLPRRAATKKFLPTVFELPGGHINFAEDPVAGLRREIQEELGVRVKVGDPFGVFTYVNEIKGSHSIEVVYFATLIDAPDAVTIQPEDHAEYRWVAEDEVPNLISDQKTENDPEWQMVRRGFQLLHGESLNYA